MMRLNSVRICFAGPICLLLSFLVLGQPEIETRTRTSEKLATEKAKAIKETGVVPTLPFGIPTHIIFSNFTVISGRTINVAARAPRAATFEATIYDENNKECISLDTKAVAANEWWVESSRILTKDDTARHVDIDVSVFLKEGDLLGTVILVTQDTLTDLTNHKETKFVPNPANPPKDQHGIFMFWLDVAADVIGEIFSTDKRIRKPLSVFKAQDLPQGPNEYRWNLRLKPKGPFIGEGLYVARFRCKSRDRKKPQHDFAMLLRIE